MSLRTAPPTLVRTLLAGSLITGCGLSGERVASEWSVELPDDTVRVDSEDVIGNEGVASSAVWFASETSVDDAVAHFAALDGASEPREGWRGHHINVATPSGAVRVLVTETDQIPETQLPPVHPIRESAPSGASCWITLSRHGEPDPCPPCEPGMTGTILPGCECP